MFKKLGVAAVAAAVFVGAPASANVITVSGGGATITCSGGAAPSCLAFYSGAPGLGDEPDSAGSLTDGASIDAWYYDGTPSSETHEAARLNTLTGGATSFDMSDASRTGSPPLSFATLAAYVVLKLGQFDVFLVNNSGGELSVSLQTGQRFGFSHYTEFGDVDEVPLPAAIWLMGAGLAGLGFAGRKKA